MVRPIQAGKSRPERNSSGAGVFIVGIVAMIGPMVRDLGQPAPALIGGVPRHQSGIERVDLGLELHKLFALEREQIAGERRQHLVSGDPFEQRNHMRHPLGSGQPNSAAWPQPQCRGRSLVYIRQELSHRLQ